MLGGETEVSYTGIISVSMKIASCDTLILVGDNSQSLRQSETMFRKLTSRSGAATSSFIKFGRVGNVLLEDPDKAAEAIILFCQGLGKLPSVLGPMTRRISRGVSMTEADKPNIGRLSLSEADA